jgi:hypothetical protein
MKKIVLSIWLMIISVNAISQKNDTIDLNNINHELLQKLVLQKINAYRKQNKIHTLIPSVELKKLWSDITASQNAKQQKLFHTKYKYDSDQYIDGKLCKDTLIFRGVVLTGEIIQSIGNLYIYNTYNELATAMIKAWIASPRHHIIIKTEFQDYYKNPGFISCSTIIKENKIYAAVNFITLGINPNKQ